MGAGRVEGLGCYDFPMTAAAQNILRQALDLAAEERAEIAGALVESLEPGGHSGVDQAWRSEVRHRLETIEAGEADWIPWDDVRAELRGRLGGEG